MTIDRSGDVAAAKPFGPGDELRIGRDQDRSRARGFDDPAFEADQILDRLHRLVEVDHVVLAIAVEGQRVGLQDTAARNGQQRQRPSRAAAT